MLEEKAVSIVKRTSMGKTLKVDVIIGVSEGKIVKMIISGDFFAYPPEALEELELEIRGKTVEEALKVIDRYGGRVKLVGASLQDVKQLIRQAVSQEP